MHKADNMLQTHTDKVLLCHLQLQDPASIQLLVSTLSWSTACKTHKCSEIFLDMTIEDQLLYSKMYRTNPTDHIQLLSIPYLYLAGHQRCREGSAKTKVINDCCPSRPCISFSFSGGNEYVTTTITMVWNLPYLFQGSYMRLKFSF